MEMMMTNAELAEAIEQAKIKYLNDIMDADVELQNIIWDNLDTIIRVLRESKKV